MDKRIIETARLLIGHSLRIKKGERLVISADPLAKDLALECYKEALLKGAHPKIETSFEGQSKIFYELANDEQLRHIPKDVVFSMKHTDAILYLSAPKDTKELAAINPKRIALRRKAMRPLQEYRVNNTKWCIFDFPCKAFAKDANMTLKEYEDFVYTATLKEWSKELKRMKRLQNLVNRTDNVRIVGKGTDLSFSIKSRNAVASYGLRNMPDGEVFTSVVEGTAEGKIYFEFPAVYGSKEVKGVTLIFNKGIVKEAKAEKNQDYLKEMIAMDKGSNKLGEFGIGQNYSIDRFTKNILLDEKIGGTIHLALGSAYKICKGKNRSALHWDMIKDLRKDGKVFFDGKIVMEGGKWLI